jgi:hypothetical protein
VPQRANPPTADRWAFFSSLLGKVIERYIRSRQELEQEITQHGLKLR